MTARLLVDLLVTGHLLFVVFALLGGLLCLWRRWMMVIHLPAALWVCLVELRGWICPLTSLEQSLRQAAGEAGYAESFIEHYLLPVLYPAGLTTDLQLVLGLFALGLNFGVYGCVALYWSRKAR